jgi:HSP20 family protein
MTTLVRFREPLRNVAMNSEFERLMSTIFESPARTAALSHHAWTPPLDVWETEGELVYAFDLPGIPEEQVTVDLEDNTLTVSGARERVEPEAGRFFRYERPFGEFTRSVALPEGSGDGEARAHFAYGVLEVHVQKPEQSKPRRIPIVPTIESAAIESGSTD